MPFELKPVTLTGQHVQLEPLTADHIDGLWAIGQHESLWRYMPWPMATREQFSSVMTRFAEWAETGEGLGFVQRAVSTGELAGGTTYLSPDPGNRHVEIGATWLTPKWQRTALNTEAKLLLMAHAFDALDCIRVEFKTDSLNEPSRTALERIGAVEEGIFRNHMVMPDGRFRHSVYFSVIDEDWPAVRAGLEARLNRR